MHRDGHQLKFLDFPPEVIKKYFFKTLYHPLLNVKVKGKKVKTSPNLKVSCQFPFDIIALHI